MTIYLNIFVCLKVDPRSVVSKQTFIDYIEIWPSMVIFSWGVFEENDEVWS